VKELLEWGVLNRLFEKEGFEESVQGFLEEMLRVNDGVSMMEMKRLQNAPLRDGRLLAVVNAMDALAERFVAGAPYERFERKRQEMEEKSKARKSKI